ncbi:MAG: hypothetical protein AAF531_16580 [Actinomycetota bacterium]
MAGTDQIPGNTDSSAIVEDGKVQRSGPRAQKAATPGSGGQSSGDSTSDTAGQMTPQLDRSRSILRLPAELVEPALDLAHIQAMPDVAGGLPEPQFPDANSRLEAAGIVTDDRVDPVAQKLLEVVNQASLIVTAELSYGSDTSTSTIWATPRQAVLSGSLTDDYVDYQPVSVSQLPQALAQLIVLQSPRFVGDVLLELDESLLEEVQAIREDQDGAARLLVDAGLEAEQAALLVELQQPDARRWTITSRWSTEDGPLDAQMIGVDGVESGQWLLTREEASETEQARVLYTPQGHGEIMSGFRGILPKNWLGTPLNPPQMLVEAGS